IFYGRPRDARDTWNVYWPKHLLEGLDPEEFFSWEFWTHPVGDGPYRYVRHVPKTMVELEANPDYFRGKPKIDRLVFKFGGGSGLTELLSGNVEVMDLKRSEIPKLAADPRFAVYYQLEPSVPWLTAIFWNQRHPPFFSSEIRRALTLAIDRRELLRMLHMPEELPIVDVPFSGRQYAGGSAASTSLRHGARPAAPGATGLARRGWGRREGARRPRVRVHRDRCVPNRAGAGRGVRSGAAPSGRSSHGGPEPLPRRPGPVHGGRVDRGALK
ncbi:MAG: ABC transporter substrate-binding protein, partial [Gemmatimonadota bacterium]